MEAIWPICLSAIIKHSCSGPSRYVSGEINGHCNKMTTKLGQNFQLLSWFKALCGAELLWPRVLLIIGLFDFEARVVL